jgi:hypothetical protein
MKSRPAVVTPRGIGHIGSEGERDGSCRCSFCFALLAAAENAERNVRRRAEERSMTLVEGGKDGRVT